MLKNKRILLTIFMVFLMLLIPTIVKAEEQFLSKIDVVVPKPIIGKTPAVSSNISVVADDNMTLQIEEIIWYTWDNTTNDYKALENSNEVFKSHKRYAVKIGYKRPNEYQIPTNTEGFLVDEFSLTMNGEKLDAKNSRTFMYSNSGDADYDYDFVFHEFGHPDVEKNISAIDITIPKPEAGKKQYGLGDVIVKADKNETLEVLAVEWYKYNSETGKYELDTVIATERVKEELTIPVEKFEIKEFKKGEKYVVDIIYNCPHKYGYSNSLVVKVNGDAIDVNNIEEFNPGSSGDLYGDWCGAKYELGEVKEIVAPDEEKEPQKTPTNEEKEKEPEKTPTDQKEEDKKKDDPTTAPGNLAYAGGTTTIVILMLVIVAIGIITYIKNRELKGI